TGSTRCTTTPANRVGASSSSRSSRTPPTRRSPTRRSSTSSSASRPRKRGPPPADPGCGSGAIAEGDPELGGHAARQLQRGPWLATGVGLGLQDGLHRRLGGAGCLDPQRTLLVEPPLSAEQLRSSGLAVDHRPRLPGPIDEEAEGPVRGALVAGEPRPEQGSAWRVPAEELLRRVGQ